MVDINNPTKGDVGYASAKALLGMIPTFGSAASELFGLVITPPLEKRRQKWMNEVAERLKQLEEAKLLEFAKLAENEAFIDTILHATTLALKTNEREKLLVLQNAVLHSGIDVAPDKSKMQIFLNLIESFTVWHIKILQLFDNPAGWFEQHGKARTSFMGGLSRVLFLAFPALENDRELVDLLWSNLLTTGLVNSSNLGTMMSSGHWESRTTSLGKEFIHFISSPV